METVGFSILGEDQAKCSRSVSKRFHVSQPGVLNYQFKIEISVSRQPEKEMSAECIST